mmetsp:Transcript_87656/g.283797  ORF Transcript_87656/g.283797 Transcript_87656/m.283797 type:complete len:231 (+) Transcript_87656:105-797(+)
MQRLGHAILGSPPSLGRGYPSPAAAAVARPHPSRWLRGFPPAARFCPAPAAWPPAASAATGPAPGAGSRGWRCGPRGCRRTPAAPCCPPPSSHCAQAWRSARPQGTRSSAAHRLSSAAAARPCAAARQLPLRLAVRQPCMGRSAKAAWHPRALGHPSTHPTQKSPAQPGACTRVAGMKPAGSRGTRACARRALAAGSVMLPPQPRHRPSRPWTPTPEPAAASAASTAGSA